MGLLYAGNDTIFESTGLYGQSSVRRVALQSGKVEVLQEMNGSYFGEGLTLLGERFVTEFYFGYPLDSAKIVITKHTVKYENHEVRYLNELEFVNGEVWANVWQGIDVLNGIAWDSNDNRLFVTGKLWPKLYEIKLQLIKKPFDNGVIKRFCLP
ncbi:hypothetical protein GH714_040077 [Hevea brasiliensis]|uniref:Glutaminyl-peptide cyclotransferase n=1 Tax=Hevea brasiliensis TaxID=3981 RepID=A0A6A6MT11_HEVBR|nr:hypothetical protein GH714_040077 [Hevea brasiliensis]